MRNLHQHYDQLTDPERELLDQLMREIFPRVRDELGLKLLGDDRAEVATDALAKWFIESRPQS